MSDEKFTVAMTQEDQLKAILYQFITLYERWAEDRQAAAKQGTDTAQLVNIFIEQVKRFQELEPQVRQQIISSIQNANTNAVKTISEEIGKEATQAVENTARQLSHRVEQVQKTLGAYQNEVAKTQWQIILTTMLTSIVTCLLLVWLLIPKPTLPLTEEQLNYLGNGKMLELVWPKLSKQEQQHWLKLADEVQYPQVQGSSDE